MIPRIGLYAVYVAVSFIVLLGVRQWLRERKEARQCAAAARARYRAAAVRIAETAELERLYAAPSYEQEER